jgi:hypothetical protein
MTGVPVLTLWRRHSYLELEGWYDVDPGNVSTGFPLLINGEVHVAPICYVSNEHKTSPLSTPYHGRYIIWEQPMSVKCAEVPN